MSVASREDKLRTIRRLFIAFARLDRDEFVSHLTEDVDFRPSAFITGKGEFHGREEVRQNMAELEEQLKHTGELIELRPVATYVDREDENRILALAMLTIARPKSEAYDTEMAHLHTMEGDKVAALRTWPDHEEGLRHLASPEQVKLPG